jgi:uncharacterized protein YciI
LTLWLVRRKRGGPWDWSRDLREQDGWDEHADIMERWVNEGFIILGGPVEGDKEVVHVIDAASEDAIREKFAEDNWEQDGKLETIAVERWNVLLDSR